MPLAMVLPAEIPCEVSKDALLFIGRIVLMNIEFHLNILSAFMNFYIQ